MRYELYECVGGSLDDADCRMKSDDLAEIKAFARAYDCGEDCCLRLLDKEQYNYRGNYLEISFARVLPADELKQVAAEIAKLEKRKAEIYAASLNAPPDEKVCDDSLAEMLAEYASGGFIEYPLTITGITYKKCVPVEATCHSGKFVAVRPVGEKHGGRTYLGLHLGDVATQVGAFHHRDTGVLAIGQWMHNPAIWVFDLGRVVFGYESWWGVIDGPEDLRKITDADIDDVWYVLALKSLYQDKS